MSPLVLLVLVSGAGAREMAYGYLPHCPGVDKPVYMPDSFIGKLWVVVQVHFPHYTYRKRFYLQNAVEEMGKDPDLDFKNRKAFVFLDGYMDTTNMTPSRISQGIHAVEGYISIAIDVQLLSSFMYPLVARTMRAVGNITAHLLKDLGPYGLRPENIELLGISLGGQTVSFVAKNYQRLTGKKVGRLTSLDPAGPCYRNQPPSFRLSPNDAEFVQVIHTSSEGYGMGTAMGHVDFYINGAEYQYLQVTTQPWCEELISHVYALALYWATYTQYPKDFVGVKCKNVQQAREHKCYDNMPQETNVVGRNADRNKPGIYYVPVKANAPFHAPKDFLKTRPIYALEYEDSMSRVDDYVFNFCFHCNGWSP